jgi:hypothetical protein
MRHPAKNRRDGKADAGSDLATSAAAQSKHIAEVIATSGRVQSYAFSRNSDGSLTRPQCASGRRVMVGQGISSRTEVMLAVGLHHFATDWGVRSVSDTATAFDPISYHQGSVWPLFTVGLGGATCRPASWICFLMRTSFDWAQDPGFVTRFIWHSFNRLTQQFTSTLVLRDGSAPAVRGLFGIDADAAHRVLYLHPHLPARGHRRFNIRVGDDFQVRSAQARSKSSSCKFRPLSNGAVPQ